MVDETQRSRGFLRVVSATLPSSPGRTNEDFLAAGANAVVLVDGAGMPPGTDQGCCHGVAWFARHLGTALLHAAVDEPDRSLAEALHMGIAHVAGLHRGSCDLAHPRSPWSTVLAVRRLGDTLEYLALADSVLLLDGDVDGDGDGDHDVRAITDDRLSELAAPFQAELRELTAGTPAYDAVFGRYVDTIRGSRNRPGGFWVASSDPDVAGHAITGTADLAHVRSAVMLTDGASRLVDTFHLASWRELVDLVTTAGPDALLTKVREAEDTDPDKTRWPRGKVNDDATAARLIFESRHKMAGTGSTVAV